MSTNNKEEGKIDFKGIFPNVIASVIGGIVLIVISIFFITIPQRINELDNRLGKVEAILETILALNEEFKELKHYVDNLNQEVEKLKNPPITIAVYNDMGILQGDVWVWSGADWGLVGPKLVDGDYHGIRPPEGNKCFAMTSGDGANNYAGWGVFLGIFNDNHELIEPHTIDLSLYKQLEFWVKSPIDLKVEIQQRNAQGRKSSPLYTRNYGWTAENSNRFQKIVIPINDFDVDISNIFCPFMITARGGDISFYIDNVLWKP